MPVNFFEGSNAEKIATSLETIADHLENLGSPEAIAEDVAAWMDEHITENPTVVIDDSLSIRGAAADAKKTGDEISDLKSAFDGVTEPIELTHSSKKMYPTANGFVASADTRTVYVECTPGKAYSIDKKVATYEFNIGWTVDEPVAGGVFTSIADYTNSDKTNAVVVAPNGANYICAYIYNGKRSHDEAIGTADEVVSNVDVWELTSFDSVARKNIGTITGRVGTLETNTTAMQTSIDENTSNVGSLATAFAGITESVNIQPTIKKIAPVSGVFSQSADVRSVYFQCTPGKAYSIDKKALTLEFSIGWTADEPVAGVSYTTIYNYNDTEITKAEVLAPEGANYIYAYIYNGKKSHDRTIGDADEIAASVEVTELTCIDSAARNSIVSIEEQNDVDVSDMIDWEIGSFASNGKNYDNRDYEIRTVDYLYLENLIGIEFDVPLNSMVCVYENEAGGFLKRYTFSAINNVDVDSIREAYPTARYLRLSVYTDTTPLADTSISAYVHFARFGMLTKKVCQAVTNINTPDVVSLHRDDKSRAEVFKTQRTASETFGNASLKLLFFTDTHNEWGKVGRAVSLMNDWGNSYFDVAVNGGDTTYTIFDTSQIAKYDAQIAKSTIPVLNTIGNHDAYSTLDGNRPLVERTSIYNAITAKVKENVPGIVQPDNAASSGLNYYYYDVGAIRIVVLDCMYWDANELSWFESVLADAKLSSKSIIAVSHYNFVSTAVDYVRPCAWNATAYEVGGSDNSLPIAAAQAVKDFQDDGGEFIIWLCGHSHGDAIKKLKSEYGSQYQLICPAFVNRASTLFKSDNQYFYNHDVLTYIVVDTYYKIVKGMRIGANINEQGMEYHTFSIKYDTGEFLSSC